MIIGFLFPSAGFTEESDSVFVHNITTKDFGIEDSPILEALTKELSILKKEIQILKRNTNSLKEVSENFVKQSSETLDKLSSELDSVKTLAKESRDATSKLAKETRDSAMELEQGTRDTIKKFQEEMRENSIIASQKIEKLERDSSLKFENLERDSSLIANQRIENLERDNQALKSLVVELQKKMEGLSDRPVVIQPDVRVEEIQTEVQTIRTFSEKIQTQMQNISTTVDGKVKSFSEELLKCSSQENKIDVLNRNLVATKEKETLAEEQIQNLTILIQKLEIPKWDQIQDAIQDQIRHNLLADGTGEIDWSLRVVSHSASYNPGMPWNFPKLPDVVLERTNRAGDCWPMSGSHGFVVVELHQPVKVSHVRLTHLDEKITWNFGSAPKRFRVLLSADNQEWKQAGEFIYEKHLKSNVQIFPLEDFGELFSFVKFEFVENHGDEKYTCVYRLRVHGQQLTDSEV